jgi:hypothetical protein
MTNYMMHGELRETISPMPPSTAVQASTVEGADDEASNNEIAAPIAKTKKQNGFRGRARSTPQKSVDECSYRVSLISKNESVVLTFFRERFVAMRTN